MLQEILQETDCYLVSQKVDKANNYKFFIDNDGDFKIADCIKINRKLRNMVDESELYPEGNYSLEISSPGVEEPLLHLRQYRKNIGRLVEITHTDATIKPQTGRLSAVTETSIALEIGKKSNNKAIKTPVSTTTVNIEFENIKQAIIQVEF